MVAQSSSPPQLGLGLEISCPWRCPLSREQNRQSQNAVPTAAEEGDQLHKEPGAFSEESETPIHTFWDSKFKKDGAVEWDSFD